MRSVSLRLCDLPKSVIPIGFVDENLHTRVMIDCKKMFDEYPSAVATLAVNPPVGSTYPAVVTRDGDFVIWDVTAIDAASDGNGEIQLTFTTGETVAKSYIGRIRVTRSLAANGEVPDPVQNWIDRANEILESIPGTIDTALQEAKDSGEFDGPQGPEGPRGQEGPSGAVGVTFTPSVSEQGVISWTNDGGRTNPESVNIKGPKGDQGDPAPAADVADAVDAYLEENFSNPSNPPLDRSLTSSLSAAPADLVGDLKNDIDATKTNLIGESDKTSRSRSITGLVTTSPTNGFYKVSNGQFAASDTYRTYEYELPEGTNNYTLSIYQRGNGANDGIYYVYMAYDDNDNLIDYRTQTVATQQLSITVPDNATRIIYTKENVDANSCFLTWKTSAFEHINALERNIAVFIGDSYVGGNSLGADVDQRFSTVLSNRMGWVEKNFAVGGMGYIYGNTTFEDQIDNAIADTTYNHDNVRYVFICGGRNDGGAYPFMDATLTNAVQSAITKARAGFQNAIIIVIPMMWDYQYISRAIYPLYQTIIYASQTLDAVVIPNAYTWLTGMKGMILNDGVHPNVTGHAIIASHIENALTTGNSFAFPSSRVLNPVSESIDGSATNYFTITQENGLIHFDAEFKLSAGVSENSTLFSLTVANNENVPAYTGNYERFLVAQKSDGTLVTLSITTTIADGGYSIIAKAVTALSVGTYYMDGEFIPFALQRFASWRS